MSAVQPRSIWSSPTRPEDLQPFRLQGGTRACLLLHGFAGTPPEVRELGEHLAAHGYDVLAPVLAGHGQTPEAMRATRWTDWAASAQAALHTLLAEREEVFVGGQSLGGSLALHLAARERRVRGVVSLAAMGSKRFFRDPRLRVIGLLKHVVPWQILDGSCDLGDPSRLLALHSYARRPTAALESLVRFLDVLERELPEVTAPALVVHGRRDQTVPVENAPFIRDHLGSQDATLRWLERSGHAVTVDLERAELNALILEWLDRH
ncbi:MAG TPA: alpha/beta fold hydrolase [Candidatus Limnocylindrales bacterium]|nr:alpha/beta fold hydrolase [Candidatus Limnocylindrales bacterium]